MESMARGKRMLPVCDRCKRWRIRCRSRETKNLTACIACAKEHAECSWKEIKAGELRHEKDDITPLESQAATEKSVSNPFPFSISPGDDIHAYQEDGYTRDSELREPHIDLVSPSSKPLLSKEDFVENQTGEDIGYLSSTGMKQDNLVADKGNTQARAEEVHVKAKDIPSILRKPTEKFPEDPEPIREGVAPHKDALKGKDIPVGARWTRIDRRLVNPAALEEAKERFEERIDCVIILRVLSKKEIQKFADRTKELRMEREACEARENSSIAKDATRPLLDSKSSRQPDGKARQLSDAEWKGLKPLLHTLYIKENMTLNATKKALSESHGLILTQKQLISQFARWNFKKNVKQHEIGEFLRKSDPLLGDAEASVDGVRITAAKRERWEKRARIVDDLSYNEDHEVYETSSIAKDADNNHRSETIEVELIPSISVNSRSKDFHRPDEGTHRWPEVPGELLSKSDSERTNHKYTKSNEETESSIYEASVASVPEPQEANLQQSPNGSQTIPTSQVFEQALNLALEDQDFTKILRQPFGARDFSEEDSTDDEESDDNGMLPSDKQRRTAFYDYTAEKQMSHTEAKQFYQRHQLETQYGSSRAGDADNNVDEEQGNLDRRPVSQEILAELKTATAVHDPQTRLPDTGIGFDGEDKGAADGTVRTVHIEFEPILPVQNRGFVDSWLDTTRTGESTDKSVDWDYNDSASGPSSYAASVASVFSVTSLASSASYISKGSGYSAVQIATATKVLLSIFYEDEALLSLYENAVGNPNIGSERLQRNLRRLFRAYASLLEGEATERLEHLASRLVRAKSASLAQSIVEKLKNDRASTQLPRSECDNGSSGEEDDDDIDSRPVNEDAFEDLVTFREFLVESEAFKTFRNQLHAFVTPNSLQTDRTEIVAKEALGYDQSGAKNDVSKPPVQSETMSSWNEWIKDISQALSTSSSGACQYLLTVTGLPLTLGDLFLTKDNVLVTMGLLEPALDQNKTRLRWRCVSFTCSDQSLYGT
jgi:hypothetical protein